MSQNSRQTRLGSPRVIVAFIATVFVIAGGVLILRNSGFNSDTGSLFSFFSSSEEAESTTTAVDVSNVMPEEQGRSHTPEDPDTETEAVVVEAEEYLPLDGDSSAAGSSTPGNMNYTPGSMSGDGSNNTSGNSRPDIDPPLPGRGHLAVRVFDPTGGNVPDVVVSAHNQENLQVNQADFLLTDQSPEQALVTDVTGGVYFFNLPEGTYLVSALAPENFPYRFPIPEVVKIGDGKMESLEIRLQEGEKLEGVVYDENREPLEGADVVAYLITDVQRAKTDSEGRFVIHGLPEGANISRLTVSYLDYSPQTRRQIFARDGLQKFYMERMNDVTMVVRWEEDLVPVEFYSYRLLLKSATGLYQVVPDKSGRVDDPKGSVELPDLRDGEWRAEVSVLGPDNQPTAIEASREFKLGEGQHNLIVIVPVSGGSVLRGYTYLNDEETIASAARVSVIPPSAGVNQPLDLGDFTNWRTRSDAEGYFEFRGLTPGNYALSASYGVFSTTKAVDVVVPEAGEAEVAKLILTEGGEIFGVVKDTYGNPVAGANLVVMEQKLNADGWNSRFAVADEKGVYSFQNLPEGAHYLRIRPGANHPQEERIVHLESGERKEENFDFSEGVLLMGQILINNEPDARANGSQLTRNGGRVATLTVDGEGNFETRILPGKYVLSPPIPGVSEPFEIKEEPDEQEQNFNFEIVDVDVIVQFKNEADFAPGQVVISPEETGTQYGFLRRRLDQENRYIQALVGGKYTATYTSFDKKWRGQTEWIKVGVGEENVFEIKAEKTTKGNKIGEWKTGDLSNVNFRWLEYDVTSMIEGNADITIVAQYESGRHAAVTKRAQIMMNGNLVGSSGHNGWTGADHFNNAYHLSLNTFQEGAEYTIRIQMKTDGGNDSNGSVYMYQTAIE